MILHFTRKNLAALIALVCLVGLAILPIIMPARYLSKTQHIGIGLCFTAILAYAVQTFIQSREDDERDARDRQIVGLLTGLSERPVPDLGMEGNVTSVDVVTAHPTEGLQTARETLLVEESLEMTEYDLQLRLAHDREFRHRFEKIPTGSNPLFDKRRNSILNEPIIAAHFRRMRLVPRYPFSNEVKQVYDLMHTKFSATADFLFEIFLTNVSVHPTTLQRITAEAEVEGKWVSLPLVNQFENYELTFDSDARFAGTAFTHMYAKAEPLKSIWDEVKGVVLERGVGYQGWVGFELVASSDAIDKPIPSRVRLIDALGGIHPVVTLAKDPPYETGRIRHSRKAYDALR